MVVPSLGYNKNLIPPPIGDNQDLFVNVSYNIKHILYIDEVENFMRITWSSVALRRFVNTLRPR